MIPSLPGKASRTLVNIVKHAKGFNMLLEAEPGKLDIKRCGPGILFISLPIVSLFKLPFSIFVLIQRHLSDVIQKVQCYHDLIKAHAVR